MTTQQPKPTAYDSFASSPVDLLTCMWGSSGRSVLGFRGGHAEITKWLTLFANLDIPVDADGNETGDPVQPPSWLHDSLVYLTTTPERIRRTLELAFHCEILRLGEVPLEHSSHDSEPEAEIALTGLTNHEMPGTDDYTDAACHWVEHGTRRVLPREHEPRETLTYETSYDHAKVVRLARLYADRFIATRIRTSSFMPPPPQTLNIEHSLGTMVSEPNDRMLEELVEQEAKTS